MWFKNCNTQITLHTKSHPPKKRDTSESGGVLLFFLLHNKLLPCCCRFLARSRESPWTCPQGTGTMKRVETWTLRRGFVSQLFEGARVPLNEEVLARFTGCTVARRTPLPLPRSLSRWPASCWGTPFPRVRSSARRWTRNRTRQATPPSPIPVCESERGGIRV